MRNIVYIETDNNLRTQATLSRLINRYSNIKCLDNKGFPTFAGDAKKLKDGTRYLELVWVGTDNIICYALPSNFWKKRVRGDGLIIETYPGTYCIRVSHCCNISIDRGYVRTDSSVILSKPDYIAEKRHGSLSENRKALEGLLGIAPKNDKVAPDGISVELVPSLQQALEQAKTELYHRSRIITSLSATNLRLMAELEALSTLKQS